MNEECFAYVRTDKEKDGFRWFEEKCFCLIINNCENCRFFKPKWSVKKHGYYIHQTRITEWIDVGRKIPEQL